MPLHMMQDEMDSSPVTELYDPLKHACIRDELARLVASREFHASDRLRGLLKYLVEHSLNDAQRKLTQRLLAADVFGRGDDFDPEHDAIVRVEMSKLRRALQNYYAQCGQHSPVTIELLKGRYTPNFIFGETGVVSETSFASRERNAPADRPVISVMPFTMSGLGSQDGGLAMDLTRELKVTLTQIPYLKIASSYCLGDARRSLEDQQALGVRFVLDGSIQCRNSNLRVTTELHDLACNEQIWSERLDYSLDPDDALTLQDEVVRTIAAHTADLYSGAINRVLMQELDLRKTSGFSTYEAILSFYRYLNQHSDQSYVVARRAVEDAAQSEPDNPLLLAMLADVRRAGYAFGYTEEPDPLPEVLALARQALNLSPNSATCRLSLCYALLQARDRNALLETAAPLLDLNLASPCHAGDAAIAVAFAGEWVRGCSIIRQIVKPLAVTPHIFAYPLFLDAYRTGDYDSAWEIAERFHSSHFFWQSILRIAVLGKLDRVAEAMPHIDELLALRPGFSEHCRRYLSCFLMEDSLVNDLIDGLQKAGLDTR